MKIDYFIFIAIYLIAPFDCVSCFENLNHLQNNMESVSISGNYTIGALFPICKSGEETSSYNGCDTITENEIQIVEAALFAIDLINDDESILPNVTLAIDIKDYRNEVEMAKLQTKQFIDESVPRCNNFKTLKNPLIGIIGPKDHKIASEVGNVLDFFSIVQIFYSEFLPQFNDNEIQHPYLFSVIPSREHITNVILKILAENNLTHVSLVHDYGLFQGNDLLMFKKSFTNNGICIGDILDNYDIVWAEFLLRNKIPDLIRVDMPSFKEIDAIVCHCSQQTMKSLFNLIKNYVTKKIVVINGNGWPQRQVHEYKYPDFAVGEIVISLEDFYLKEFDDYFLRLNLTSNKRNPWFAHFWRDHFKCKVNSSNETGYQKCSGDENLTQGYKQDSSTPYVIKSVFVLANALHNMLENGCEGANSSESAMKNDFNRSCYRNHVQNVTFDFFGNSFKFKYDHTPELIKFNIYNFRRFKNKSYNYQKVGEYSNDENNTDMRIKTIETPFYVNKDFFKSTCKVPCAPNQAQIIKLDSEKCCWNCKSCSASEILNGTQCDECKDGLVPDSSNTSCVSITVLQIKWNDGQILISLAFSSIVIALTTFAFYVFIKNDITPVVKSSTKELCYMMFVGMISANLTPFAVLFVRNIVNCWIVKILPSVSFAFIYAALLVKTNRIARILAMSKKKFPKLNPRFLSLRAQILFAILLIITEALICSYSLFHNPPKTDAKTYEKNGKRYKINTCLLNEEIMFEMFGFIGGLILICTYYAVKTRNLPENFNEAKCIGLAMYATILTDISAAVIYFETEFKILTINLFISINTLIVFMFLFAPKLFIIIWRPEKNTRFNFITTTSIRCSISNRQKSDEHESRQSNK